MACFPRGSWLKPIKDTGRGREMPRNDPSDLYILLKHGMGLVLS